MGNDQQERATPSAIARAQTWIHAHRRKITGFGSTGLGLALGIIAFVDQDAKPVVFAIWWALKEGWPLEVLLLIGLVWGTIALNKKWKQAREDLKQTTEQLRLAREEASNTHHDLDKARHDLEQARKTRPPKIPRGRWETVKLLTCGHVEYSPFLQYGPNAEPIGFGPDLLRHLLASTGIELKYSMPGSTWSSVIGDLAGGSEESIDLIATPLFATYDRSCDVTFTSPLFFCDIGLYVNKEFYDRFYRTEQLFAQAIQTLSEVTRTRKFYFVPGEISEKLAKKHHGNAELKEMRAMGENPVSAGLSQVANCPAGEGAFMFCEVVHAKHLPWVKAGQVVNVLEQNSILYPVAFAVRKGDYVLQNLLNILILEMGGPENVLEILSSRFKRYVGDETADIRNYYATQWKSPRVSSGVQLPAIQDQNVIGFKSVTKPG